MIKNKKTRFILTSLMMVMLLLFAFKTTVNADTSAQWQLRTDDYYWIGKVSFN